MDATCKRFGVQGKLRICDHLESSFNGSFPHKEETSSSDDAAHEPRAHGDGEDSSAGVTAENSDKISVCTKTVQNMKPRAFFGCGWGAHLAINAVARAMRLSLFAELVLTGEQLRCCNPAEEDGCENPCEDLE
eukprot:929959-Amphidinium_carterae.1